ncbi:MAG: hypothetical protein J7466_13460, partial [Roseiflexus sp.]|nr:hypothetical protein [Roseiflexus sp.]
RSHTRLQAKARSSHDTSATTLFILVAAQLVAAVGFGMPFPFLPLYVKRLGTNTGLWRLRIYSSSHRG